MYEVVGWYRYANGDEKDFISAAVSADDAENAKELFKQKYNRRFFSITVKQDEVN